MSNRPKGLATGPARLRPMLAGSTREDAQRARDRQRAKDAARKLYQTQAWRDLRLEVLERDGWQCQQTGVYLVEGRTLPHSAVVDHIVPHRGDPALFWDRENLQSVAKSWHDKTKQAEEKQAARGQVRPGGWVRF
ncbi:HNH endonuclease [Sulfitobacter sp. 1A16787]|uniref:HNH endonuclease n=1 Tax=Sulfitobacter sp. 1A16787 TaxID=3368571 RepID=UPI003746BC0E